MVRDTHNATEASMTLKNKRGQVKVPHDNSLIEESAGYVAKGSGEYRLRVKKRIIHSKDNWFLLSLVSVICGIGWTRPDPHEPVILIEQLKDCQPYPWDTRPCQTFAVQNGFAGWERRMTVEETNQLISTLDETVCHPQRYKHPSTGGWIGIRITPVNPFGDTWPPHFTPNRWEVRCGK